MAIRTFKVQPKPWPDGSHPGLIEYLHELLSLGREAEKHLIAPWALSKLACHMELAIEGARSEAKGARAEYPHAAVDLFIMFHIARKGSRIFIRVPMRNYSSPRIAYYLDTDDPITGDYTFGRILTDYHASVAETGKYSFQFKIENSIIRSIVRPVAALEYLVTERQPRGGPDSLRPRWAEENRPKKQVKLRLSPDLIEQIDQEASGTELTRNDWIERAILNALKPS